MKQILLTILVPVVSLLASLAHAQMEPPPNHDKLQELMGWRIGEWKAIKATRTTNEGTTDVPDPQFRIDADWDLDGQVVAAAMEMKWTTDSGETRSLKRKYTYYWDRLDEKFKVVWFSTFGTVRHGVLEKVEGKTLTWKWRIDSPAGRRGTCVVVESLQNDGTIVSTQTRTLDDGTELDRGTVVLKKIE